MSAAERGKGMGRLLWRDARGNPRMDLGRQACGKRRWAVHMVSWGAN